MVRKELKVFISPEGRPKLGHDVHGASRCRSGDDVDGLVPWARFPGMTRSNVSMPETATLRASSGGEADREDLRVLNPTSFLVTGSTTISSTPSRSQMAAAFSVRQRGAPGSPPHESPEVRGVDRGPSTHDWLATSSPSRERAICIP